MLDLADRASQSLPPEVSRFAGDDIALPRVQPFDFSHDDLRLDEPRAAPKAPATRVGKDTSLDSAPVPNQFAPSLSEYGITVETPHGPRQAQDVLAAAGRGTAQGFGDAPVGFSAENREKYPLTYRTWQPFIAPLDVAARLSGAAIGGLAAAGAETYRQLGGDPAWANRLERDFNGLGQGALIESGMRSSGAAARRPRDAAEPTSPAPLVAREADAVPVARAEAASAPLSAEARKLPELPQGSRIVEHGDHGPVIEGLQDRFGDALDWMRQVQAGDARGVLTHPDVPGPIDLIWGGRRYGLAHIEHKHPGALDLLPQVWPDLSLTRGDHKFIELQGPTAGAVVARDYAGDPKNWLLTFFERYDQPPEPQSSTPPRGSGDQPGLRPTTDLRSPLSRRYGGEGAEPKPNLSQDDNTAKSPGGRAGETFRGSGTGESAPQSPTPPPERILSDGTRRDERESSHRATLEAALTRHGVSPARVDSGLLELASRLMAHQGLEPYSALERATIMLANGD